MKKLTTKATPGRTTVQHLVVNRTDVMPIIKSICTKKRFGAPSHVDYQDIVGAAFLGIADARRKFRKAKKVKFFTYATTRVTGSVKDYIRREHNYARRYVVQDEIETDLVPQAPSSEVRLGNRDLYEAVCKVASDLPPDQLFAIVGFYLEERLEKDLADEMSLSVVALRKLIVTALETVRSRFIGANPGRRKAWVED